MPSDDELLRMFLAGHDAPCPSCGYNMRGASSGSCPECGTKASLALAARRVRPPVRLAMGILALYGAMYVYGGVVWLWMLAKRNVASSNWARWEVGKSILFSLMALGLLVWFAGSRGRPDRGAIFVRATLWLLLLMIGLSFVMGLASAAFQ